MGDDDDPTEWHCLSNETCSAREGRVRHGAGTHYNRYVLRNEWWVGGQVNVGVTIRDQLLGVM